MPEAMVRGPHEERVALLMRDADCNSAAIIAVIQLGRALDAQAELIDLLSWEVMILRDRLDAQPQPPVAREQMRMVAP